MAGLPRRTAHAPRGRRGSRLDRDLPGPGPERRRCGEQPRPTRPAPRQAGGPPEPEQGVGARRVHLHLAPAVRTGVGVAASTDGRTGRAGDGSRGHDGTKAPVPPWLGRVPGRYDDREVAIDPEVIQAIEAAVAADPGNSALRIPSRWTATRCRKVRDALTQAEAVLGAEPDQHVDALGLAAEAGLLLDDARAPGWARLHASLTGAPGNGPHPGVPIGEPVRQPAGDAPVSASPGVGDSGPDDWDRLLKEVLADAGPSPDAVTLGRRRRVGGGEGAPRAVVPRSHAQSRAASGLRGPDAGRVSCCGAHPGAARPSWPGPWPANWVHGSPRWACTRVLDMWLGNSEKQLHELFEMAPSEHPPCVLFFDELDAIGHSRMDLGRSAARNVVAQLLVELDGVEHSNEGMFVIGATNQPWDVDPALRRPGRFDRTLLVLPPDAPRPGGDPAIPPAGPAGWVTSTSTCWPASRRGCPAPTSDWSARRRRSWVWPKRSPARWSVRSPPHSSWPRCGRSGRAPGRGWNRPEPRPLCEHLGGVRRAGRLPAPASRSVARSRARVG